MTRRSLASSLVALAVLATAACGERWSDEQRAALSDDTNVGAASAIDGGTERADASAVAPEAQPVAGADGGAYPIGGPASATGGPAGPSGPAPCTAASSAPGVTDDAITIGSISTLSGPVPGLGSTSEAAARAYVAYRNATGGVCGRKVVLKTGDDGQDAGRYRSVLQSMAPSVLGIAGGLAAGDSGGADVMVAQRIPAATEAISIPFENAPTVFDLNPPFENPNALIGKYKFLYDQGVRTAAIVLLAVDQTRAEVAKHKPQMEVAGIKVVSVQELPLSTLSYDSPARTVANSKADYLFFVADYTQSASMAKSMQDTGYKLKFQEHLVAYGSGFIPLAGSASEGVTSWIRSLPDEERGKNAEQNAYLAWMAKVAPKTVPDTFSASSWVSLKVFLDSLSALPGPISREALVAQMKSIETYDAGGMWGPIQFGAERTNGCFIGMKVVDGRWTRLAPASGFLC